MNTEQAAMMQRRVNRVLWEVKLRFLRWDCGGEDSTMVGREISDDYRLSLKCAYLFVYVCDVCVCVFGSRLLKVVFELC